MPLPLRLSGSAKEQQPVAYAAVEVDPNRSDTDISNQQSVIAGWPSSPQRVWTSPFWIVGDLVLLLLPIAFIALDGLAHKLDQKPLSPYGKSIQDTILLGPTLFPLAFAALGGRSLQKLTLWNAERGTTLGALEHLIGSQSLVATVGHAISLHSLNFLTFGMLVLWALSPLGGQSALRLIHQTNTTISETRPIFYANVDATSDFPKESYNRDASHDSRYSRIHPSRHLEPPKIPRIAALEQDAAQDATSREWYTVEKHPNQTYASLTGVDVLKLVEKADANFTIPYEYMYFDCSLHSSTNATNSMGVLKYLSGLQQERRLATPSTMTFNSTSPLMERGFFIFGISDGVKPEKLSYGSQFFSGSIYLFECSMNSVLIEANIECASNTCETKRLRRLNTPRAQRYSTHLPYDVVRDRYTFKSFIGHIPGIGGNTSIYRPNPIDAYVYGDTPWSMDSLGQPPRNNWTQYIGMPEKSVEMSHRLTKLLNTYWDASRWPLAITRNDSYAKSSLNVTSGEPLPTLTMNKTEAIITRQVAIYKAETSWIVSLVICSGILFVLGLVSFILSVDIAVPDIFDYVSSFTRDNPYINAPAGGSGLDGAERARLLRKLPVQLGDVDAVSDAGYIAMRSVEGERDRQQRRVRRERMYR